MMMINIVHPTDPSSRCRNAICAFMTGRRLSVFQSDRSVKPTVNMGPDLGKFTLSNPLFLVSNHRYISNIIQWP